MFVRERESNVVASTGMFGKEKYSIRLAFEAAIEQMKSGKRLGKSNQGFRIQNNDT